MEYTLIIDPEKDESLVLTMHERNETVEAIERIIGSKSSYLTAYGETDAVRFFINEADCYFTDSNKVFTCIGSKKYLLKQRLYQVEECLGDDFIRINQGCIINVNRVKKFDMSLVGTIKVILANGFEDYISRRQLKTVKRRFGI